MITDHIKPLGWPMLILCKKKRLEEEKDRYKLCTKNWELLTDILYIS